MKISRPICARFVALACLGLIVALALSRVAQAASGTWTNTSSGGMWSGTGNWSAGTIATGTDAIANFSTLNITADNTVHLDSTRTIGSLLFGDTTPSNNWILDNNGNAANILTLDVTAGAPGITVNNQTATISAVLAGSDGLAKSGAGTLVLGGTNTLTGGVVINAGTLQLNSTGVLTAAGNISIATTSGNSGTLTLTGASSSVTQTGASTLTVGNSGAGTAALNIGTTTSGAAFFTSTGAMTIRPTGTVNIGSGVNAGTLWANGDVSIDGGTLARGSSGSAFNLAPGKTMAVTNGGLASFSGNYVTANSTIYNIAGAGSQLETLSGSLTINNGAQVNVTAGGAVAVNNPLSIGTTGSGMLSVDGAGSAVVASLATWGDTGDTANVTFSNLAAGTFTTTTLANSSVANTTAAVDVKSGADVMVGALSLAASGGATTSAALTISDPGSTVTLSPGSILTIGHASTGTAVISALAGGALAVGSGGSTNLNARGTLNIDGGIVDLKTINDNGGTINFYAGSLSFLGNLTIGTGGLLGDGDLTLGSHDQLILSGATTVDTSRSLTLDGGTLSTAALTVNGAFIFNSGTLTITQSGASINYPIVSNTLNATINVGANNVSLGSAASLTGFIHQGTLNVGANTVTLNSAGYSRLGILTTVNGGTINAPNGVYLSGGGNLIGNGVVTARITGDSGSVIEANGALALGDAVSPAGFNFDGELRTKQNIVTLISSATAGLGSLTTLGNGGSPGTLNATNGFVVDFDEAVTGYGTINSTNTLAKHATINGTMQGNSVGQPITLSGYIKGVGTFANVNFSGTYSPGLSPTIVSAGSVAFSPTSMLIMELGGTLAGSGYDQIQSSGALAFDGTLQVSLINGFTPSAGQSFNIFDWSIASGTFDTLQLPALVGLTWNTSQLYTTGVLSVAAAGLPGDFNNDGKVDAGDYATWRKNNGTNNALANDNGLGTPIGTGHYNLWRANFGKPPGSGSGVTANATVPEPAALVMLMFAAAAAVCSRLRRAV